MFSEAAQLRWQLLQTKAKDQNEPPPSRLKERVVVELDAELRAARHKSSPAAEAGKPADNSAPGGTQEILLVAEHMERASLKLDGYAKELEGRFGELEGG